MRKSSLARVIAATAMSLAFCMPAYAEFTAKKFLQWERSSQSSYIRTILLTANTIASQNDKKQSECMGNWFEKDRVGNEKYILEIMGKNPAQHPLAIVIAVAERKCGSFRYTQP